MILDVTLTVFVSNVDRALDFYTRVLGLGLKENYGSKYAEVQKEGFVIGLHLKDNANPIPNEPNSMSIGLRVENLERSMAELRNKGLTFSTAILDAIEGRFAYFEDPDGNQLYLWQSKM